MTRRFYCRAMKLIVRYVHAGIKITTRDAPPRRRSRLGLLNGFFLIERR